MATFSIKRFTLENVLKVLFNTNNHYEEGECPSDYYTKIHQCDTKHWIDRFHTRYHKVTLDTSVLRWLRKAVQLGTLTGRISALYKDDLSRTCARYADQMKPLQDDDWFVRTDGTSLKYGVHHAGPYRSLKPILESMITGIYGHEPFDDTDTSCTLYFLPWLDMAKDKEFRIFVYQNQITAISAQHLFQKNTWLNAQTDTQLKALMQRIVAHFESHIRDKLTTIGSYTMDLVLLGKTNEPYFIEPNTFGAKYAAGSALFHWLHDADMLHDPNHIQLRFVG